MSVPLPYECMTQRLCIPPMGRNKEKLLEEMSEFRQSDADWKHGRTWSMVYYAGEEHYDFLKKAHHLYFSENGLNPMAFKSLKRMEAEVVQMTADMLHGPDKAVGTMTSGGTESILLAVKTYRDRARKKKPWILRPEMVVPETIHVAFNKASHYFGVKMRFAKIDGDGRVNVEAMKKLVNKNTIMMAASAPQYPHGVVDPIVELGAFAQRKKIPFHVDACFGGFMLPWLEKLGYPIPVWDFRVSGVTSISADVHKYGYAAKGASVIVYRGMDYLRHQFFVATDWSGGIYASPSLPGTRPGGSIAAAWAAMQAMGEDGYMRLAKEAMMAALELKEGIESIPGLKVIGKPNATVVSWGSAEEGIDVYAVADQMAEKGWSVDRQQNPACIHCTVNANNRAVIENYLQDLREATEYVRQHPELKKEGEAAMYGMMAKVPVRGLVKQSVLKVMEAMYSEKGDMPDLTKVGENKEDGWLMNAINKYGDSAMEVLDQVNGLRKNLKERLGRG